MSVYRSPDSVIYTGEDRREVEVLVDGVWRYGELRGWQRDAEGAWKGSVTWSAGPGQNRLDNFPAEQIRPLEEDA